MMVELLLPFSLQNGGTGTFCLLELKNQIFNLNPGEYISPRVFVRKWT